MMEYRRSGKLAVILHADIAGSTALVQQDEHLAHERIQDTFRRFSDTIGNYQGRVCELRGDALLAEFERASDAVSATLAFQAKQAKYISQLNDNILPKVRVGIAMGEVIIADSTITGAGVVVAQRVEQLAEPGGVCITAALHEALPKRMPFELDNMGEQSLKGFDDQIRVYKVSLSSGARIPEPDTPLQSKSEAPKLPDKPSIAVLPFDNMSGEPEQDYFVDGLTEDIITELSRFQSFLVIARHSTFVYKGKPVAVQDVGHELNVRYVVEGSVRKAGDRMRVTVQLIEVISGNHIWAERYDYDVTDIFELQDMITRSIVAAIPGRLEIADLNRIKRKRPEDMAVYDYVLRGKMHHHRSTMDDNTEALRLLDKAIELDPEFSEAYAWKACTLGQALARGFGDDKEDLFKRDVEACEKALSLNENNFECHWIMCEVRMLVTRLEDAELHHQKAFDLNSNDPRVVAQRSELLTYLGHPLEAADWARQAMRLDPFNAAGRAHLLGLALYVAGNYADAIEAFRQVHTPSFKHNAEIAACHAQLGSDEKARQHVTEVLRLKPDFSIADHVQGLPFKEQSDRSRYWEGLTLTGLPE